MELKLWNQVNCEECYGISCNVHVETDCKLHYAITFKVLSVIYY